jgi:shikimate kinase
MLASGVCVWLQAPLETIYRRVCQRKTRPLLLETEDDPYATLAQLLSERTPLYGQAHVVVESQDEAPDKTVDRVMEKIQHYQCHSFPHTPLE